MNTKETKEKARVRAEKKADFIERYNRALGLEGWWTFSVFDNMDESKDTARIRVVLVKYLLNNRGNEIKMKDILHELNIPYDYSLCKLTDSRSKLSPIGAGIIKNKPRCGYYIVDTKKANIWLKFMKELIERDW
jgi:hypothetical protein